jgi:fatty acyl-CoA reductase
MSQVAQFLHNQTIFLTGATGFLGKVMLWKALREAGEGVKIYVLVRSSKDADARKRVDEIFSTKIFDDLLASKPHLREKVCPLDGDITKEDFGLSEESLALLYRETTTIIHSAATTKFTENLKLAVDINVLAVGRMVKIAKRCPRLVSLVHISTCYVAADKINVPAIYEQVYPMKCSPEEVIQRVANISLEEADRITDEVIHPYPNTYSFTKSLGEHLLMAERGNLPVCVLRPSIVTAAIKEPLPGWIDVLLGPAGLFLATGVGALRIMKGSPDNIADFVPVDTVCNAIFAAAWRNVKLAKENPELFPSSIPIYHIATSFANPLRWAVASHIVPPYFQLHRPKRGFGYPYAIWWSHYPTFGVFNWLVHFLPAYTVDAMRVLRGKKAFLVRATTRLNRAISTLGHFTTNNWFFANHTTEQLHADLSDVDKKLFKIDVKSLEWYTYFITLMHGIRKFLLKDDEPEPVEKKQVKAEGKSLLRSIMDNMRSYLVIISLGCLVYFFRQNFWLLKLRARKIREAIQKTTLRLTAATVN